jgi:diguanylate cyclase (GGDEF)-like protein
VEHIGFFGSSGHGVGELQLFRDADQAQSAAALAGCAVVHLGAGQRLEVSNRARLYIVLKGALAIEADTSSGLADGSTSKILPGESVGEQSVLDDATSMIPVAALEDSELLLIEADLVWTLIDDVNGFARNLLRLLSFRIRAANAVLRRRQKLGEFYRQLSMNDGLTGLYNRAWLNDMLPKMVASAQRSGAPLSLIMIDLDNFKQFNDSHGHLAGDDALRAAAGVIGTALRPSDFAVRYGGEEMMVLLPDTGRAAAALVAGRLCERMAQAVIFKDMRVELPHVTGSFGVAELEGGMDEQGLAAAADAALYRAKASGRNQVSL